MERWPPRTSPSTTSPFSGEAAFRDRFSLFLPVSGDSTLPRKPNYKFERMERDRQKAAKKAARLQAKADRKATVDENGNPIDTPEQTDAAETVERNGSDTEQT